jgi:hypothetical protein
LKATREGTNIHRARQIKNSNRHFTIQKIIEVYLYLILHPEELFFKNTADRDTSIRMAIKKKKKKKKERK